MLWLALSLGVRDPVFLLLVAAARLYNERPDWRMGQWLDRGMRAMKYAQRDYRGDK